MNWNITGTLEEQVQEIHYFVETLGMSHGYGYMTFVLCKFFRFSYPFQIRFLWDPKRYMPGNKHIFDLIQVHRLLEDVASFSAVGASVHPHCYQCGIELENKNSDHGSSLSFYLCKDCDGKHPVMSDDDAQIIHEAILREKGESKND